MSNIVQVSYSRIGTFKQCPYQYKLRYVEKLKTKFNLKPDNPLALGTAIHTGIEKNSILEAIKNYYDNYPTVTPLMINEALKIENVLPQVIEKLPRGTYELQLNTDEFIGYIDLLHQIDCETYDLYDFKYSNNVKNYLESGQLHIYKYYFEKMLGFKIRNMYFAFVPKVTLKQEEYESIDSYRERLVAECKKQEVNIVPVKYDEQKVIEFFQNRDECLKCEKFDKKPSFLCRWCDYENYCKSNGKNDGNIIYPNGREDN